MPSDTPKTPQFQCNFQNILKEFNWLDDNKKTKTRKVEM